MNVNIVLKKKKNIYSTIVIIITYIIYKKNSIAILRAGKNDDF